MPVGVDDVETAVFEGEAVLFRESTRAIHRLNALAGAVWVMCDGETTVTAMVGRTGRGRSTPTPPNCTPRCSKRWSNWPMANLLQGMSDDPAVVMTPVDEEASDGSRIIACPPDY